MYMLKFKLVDQISVQLSPVWEGAALKDDNYERITWLKR